MNSEWNLFEANDLPPAGPPQPADPDPLALDGSEVEAMRLRLHELANVLTGLAIAGSLLCERLQAVELRRYAANIRDGGERGSVLVCELRRALLALSGGAEEGGCGEAVRKASAHDF
jgi:hypothetical protein